MQSRYLVISKANIPSESKIEELWNQYETPPQVRAHQKAVAARTMELFDLMTQEKQKECNRELLFAAAELHDIVRSQKHHEREGGTVLSKEGYPELAEIVIYHSDFPEEQWNSIYAEEKLLLYLADKQTSGTKRVTIEQRFENSRKKIMNQNSKEHELQLALQAHDRRYKQALAIEKLFGGYINEAD